jgi:hypothetical protein
MTPRVVSVVAWSRTTGEMPHGHGFRRSKGSSGKATVASSSPMSGLDLPPDDYSRIAVNRVVIALRLMARPGLEPGTPRFSDVRSKPSNPAERPANQRVPQQPSQAAIPADSILSMGTRAMTAVLSPFPTVTRPPALRSAGFVFNSAGLHVASSTAPAAAPRGSFSRSPVCRPQPGCASLTAVAPRVTTSACSLRCPAGPQQACSSPMGPRPLR